MYLFKGHCLSLCLFVFSFIVVFKALPIFVLAILYRFPCLCRSTATLFGNFELNDDYKLLCRDSDKTRRQQTRIQLFQ